MQKQKEETNLLQKNSPVEAIGVYRLVVHITEPDVLDYTPTKVKIS
jgi:hypothetical protein